MITVNAKVHGWVSTFDVGTLELIQSGSLSASDVMSLHLSAQSEKLAELRQSADQEEEIRNLGNQPAIYRKFQVEEGSAIIARLEVEKFYRTRITSRADQDSKSSDPEEHKSSLLIEDPVSPEPHSAEIRAELSTSKINLDTTNAELASRSAELRTTAEKMDMLKSERDLYKMRFQKLALWVYKNQDEVTS